MTPYQGMHKPDPVLYSGVPCMLTSGGLHGVRTVPGSNPRCSLDPVGPCADSTSLLGFRVESLDLKPNLKADLVGLDVGPAKAPN